MQSSRLAVLALIVGLLTPLAPTALASSSSLGKIEFPNTGSPAAQDAFVRGVLLLHSFEYEDAREAFREASTLDPDFALAYWGEAMTHNQPLWRQQNLEAARAALARFGPTPSARAERTVDPRERMWLAAVELLYGDGDKLTRDLAYSEAMASISARYPNDLEARAFHALSILGTAQGERDFSIYMRAGAVAEEVFAVNPLHPGAVHYLIHSYDDPIHAPLGLRAARVYAQIAPAASHAQHMISHIYIAMGEWAESVAANVEAVRVSVERRARKDLGPDAVSYHALHWLEYSYLQLGRWEDARATLALMTELAEESRSETALWHHAAMRATWLIETGGLTAPEPIDVDRAQITGRAASIFADGFAGWRRGDVDAAASAAVALEGALESTAVTHCAGASRYAVVSTGDLDGVGVMRTSLQAMIALSRGDAERALHLIEEAASAEARMPLEYGPPAIVKPSHEIWGEMLLSLDRPREAQEKFETALTRAPRRTRSLVGLVNASAAARDVEALTETCATLRDVLGSSDETVPLPSECAPEVVNVAAHP